MSDKSLLRVREVTARLGISRPTLYRLIERGELAKLRIGGNTRFRPEDIDALIERAARRGANRAT